MKKRTKYMLLLVLVLSLISILTYSYTFARYVSNHAWNYYLSTKGFYFSSEQLGVNKITNVNNNWTYDSTYFTLKNSENNFLVTDYDIEYTVKCTIQNETAKHSKCNLNGTNIDTFNGIISSSSKCINKLNETDVSSSNKEECEKKGYEWKIQENFKDLYFDVVKTDDEELNYVSVLIEVTTTSPYKKTISGEFNLSSTEMQENGFKINYKEFDNYNRVIITNPYDENKCVKLNWNSENLRIDETNNQILSYQKDSNGNINEIKFNIDKKDSISYIFYKTDFSKEYDSEEFNLVESNDC